MTAVNIVPMGIATDPAALIALGRWRVGNPSEEDNITVSVSAWVDAMTPDELDETIRAMRQGDESEHEQS
jgi:hypothetical protein